MQLCQQDFVFEDCEFCMLGRTVTEPALVIIHLHTNLIHQSMHDFALQRVPQFFEVVMDRKDDDSHIFGRVVGVCGDLGGNMVGP